MQRTKYAIIKKILVAIHEKKGKTKIMESSGTNHKLLEKYLNFLLERKLINCYQIDEAQKFEITDKGLKLLWCIENIELLLNTFQS